MTEKNIEVLRNIVSIQGSDGNWNANEYMLGLYNGLALALATIEGKETTFRELPSGIKTKEVNSNA